MRILVTGGTGYIGSHTCVELLNEGYDVVVVDNLCNSKSDVIERIERICGKTPKFYEADVSDKESLSQIFREQQIDAVIHFAGLKAVGESCKIPLRYYRNNLDSTLTLLECMEEAGCKKIVFSSSFCWVSGFCGFSCIPQEHNRVKAERASRNISNFLIFHLKAFFKIYHIMECV